MISTKEVGKAIRQLRKVKGKSLEQLAYEANISFSTLNRLERGIGNPTLETLFGIAQSLEVDIIDLFANDSITD